MAPRTIPDGNIEVERVPCPGCGSSGPFAFEASGPDFDNRACGDQEFSLVRCDVCRTYFLNPRPTASMLSRIYHSDDYYAYTFSEHGNPIVLRARRRRDREKVTAVLRGLARAPASLRVLDIGAGDGALLEAFKAEGVPAGQLTALDLEPKTLERLRGRGFETIAGRVEDADLGAARFDVISMIQVIEHVADPAVVLARCREALRPDGVCLLETPNMESWDRVFFRRRLWGGYHFPRHWTLWSGDTLASLLDRTGFDVLSMTTPAAAVTWAWSLSHVAQAWGAPPRVADWFGLKNPALLGGLWALEIVPSLLGRSANLRIVARAR